MQLWASQFLVESRFLPEGTQTDGVVAAFEISDCCFVNLFTERAQDPEHQCVCGPVRGGRRSGLSPHLSTNHSVTSHLSFTATVSVVEWSFESKHVEVPAVET